MSRHLLTPPEVPFEPMMLAARITERLADDNRFILGIVGPPGVGKSTVVRALAEACTPRPVVVVPMDGFHLANAIIKDTPLQHRKGAIDTFDSAGYAVLLQRLQRRDEDIVYAPDYIRTLEEPVAASIAVPREAQLVLVEGNYLLAPNVPWTTARSVMDEVWYLEAPHSVRVNRLILRHIEFGKSEQDARDWVHNSDEMNAQFVQATRSEADLVVRLT